MENLKNKITHKEALFINSIFFIILLGTLTAFDPLSIDMYLPAFPFIQKDLGTTISRVELSLTSFFIGMSLGQLVYGPLADRFGRKKPLLIGMLIYMFATLGCALTTNINMLIIMRVCQAFGGCAGMVITRAIIRDTFDSKKMTNFFSSLTLVMGLAPILAPSIGGLILNHYSWRGIFYILFLANVVCFFLILYLMPETHFNRPSELKFKTILKNYLELLKDKHFIGYTIPDSFIRAGMFAYIAGSPFVFMELYKIETKYYGIIFGCNAMGLILASQLNRVFIKHYTSEQILKAIRPMILVAAIGIFVLPLLFSSIIFLIIPLFLYLFCLGLVGPNSSSIVLGKQGHRAGMASALYGMIQWGTAILTTFLVSTFHNNSILPMSGTMLLCALLSLIGFNFFTKKMAS